MGLRVKHASPLDGRTVHLQLDVVISPPSGSPVGHTDAGMDLAQRLALETGLAARYLAGPGSTVNLKKDIKVY